MDGEQGEPKDVPAPVSPPLYRPEHPLRDRPVTHRGISVWLVIATGVVGMLFGWSAYRTPPVIPPAAPVAVPEIPASKLPAGHATFEYALDARWPRCLACRAWMLPTAVIVTNAETMEAAIALVCPSRHVIWMQAVAP